MRVISNNLRKRGSALLIVIITTFAISVILGTAMRNTVSEMRMNSRKKLNLEARNAAHGMAEYVRAELSQKFEETTYISADEFPDDGAFDSSMLKNMKLMIADNKYSNVDADSFEVKVYVNKINEWTDISRDNPAFIGSDLAGVSGLASTIDIYAKATANSGNQSVTAYVKQTLMIMDSPLLQNAVFYNHDAEVYPADDMSISGGFSVVNGSLYVSPSKQLSFGDEVRVAGDLWYASTKTNNGSLDPADWDLNFGTKIGNITYGDTSFHIPADDYTGSWSGMVSSELNFQNGEKNQYEFYEAYMLDARQPDWEDIQLSHFEGMLIDSTGGANPRYPVGLKPTVSDVFSTAENEYDNPGYALIEPVLNENHPDFKGDNIREQKVAYNAGLILRVEADTSFTPVTDDDDNVTNINEQWIVKGYKYNRDSEGVPIIVNGEPELIEVTLTDGLIGDVNADFTGLENTTKTHPEKYEEVEYDSVYNSSDPDYDSNLSGDTIAIGGFREMRQRLEATDDSFVINSKNKRGQEVHTFTIDMSKLSEYVENNTLSPDKSYDTATDWNGVLYFETPTSRTPDSKGVYEKGTSASDEIHTARTDKIVKGQFPELVLQVINAEALPQPDTMEQLGFTLATNGPLYTIGHFNADGDVSEEISPTQADTNLGASNNRSEIPAALIADTYTPLSSAWQKGRETSGMSDNMGNSSKNKRIAVSTEISAAVISGTSPTEWRYSRGSIVRNGIGSGGIQNFLRRHEKWINTALVYRGAINSLFYSESHPVSVYQFPSGQAPKRWWGYHEYFAAGKYPPGIPTIRGFMLTQYEEISPTEYKYGG